MSRAPSGPRIGVALGGGGARGLAHILVVEAFDEMGLKPAAITGCSIGAIVGAAWAGGATGAAMREAAHAAFGNRATALGRLWELRPKSIAELWRNGGLRLGQFDPERVLEVFLGDLLPREFEALAVPLTVVATDFHEGAPSWLTTGDLRRAVGASMALPAILKPVVVEGRVLIDGGVVDPIPVEALGTHAVDLKIGVDVLSHPDHERGGKVPTQIETIVGTTQLLMRAVGLERLVRHPPDLLLRPPVSRYLALDFLSTPKILERIAPFKDEVKREVDALLARTADG